MKIINVYDTPSTVKRIIQVTQIHVYEAYLTQNKPFLILYITKLFLLLTLSAHTSAWPKSRDKDIHKNTVYPIKENRH